MGYKRFKETLYSWVGWQQNATQKHLLLSFKYIATIIYPCTFSSRPCILVTSLDNKCHHFVIELVLLNMKQSIYCVISTVPVEKRQFYLNINLLNFFFGTNYLLKFADLVVISKKFAPKYNLSMSARTRTDQPFYK